MSGNKGIALLHKLNARSARKSSELKSEPISRTQKAAKKILDREEENAKRSRLQSLLLHQFSSKYGTKQANSEINNYIRETVINYIACQDLSDAEANLQQLENDIKSFGNSLKSSVKVLVL